MKLTVEGVGKRYKGSFWGLKDFSLELGPGVLGLLGPNGAGKSTLMRILATITKPTEGRALWNGVDVGRSPDGLRAVLGYLPQDFGVYPHLNAVEFLEYMAAVKGIDGRAARARIEELLVLVNLTEARKRPLGGFSGGMRQRIGIAQALLNDPRLLIVDEPTVGLDPEERVRFRNLLSDLGGERIVILSTHIVSDVEATATGIAIMDRGRLLASAGPEELLRAVEGKVWDWVLPSADLPAARERFKIGSTVRRADGVHARVVSVASDVPPAPTALTGPLYALGKAGSKFAVLFAMGAVLAAASVVIQLTVAEDPHLRLGALLLPCPLLALPVMALVAAAAVLFETVPLLRHGFGNVAWFFAWTAVMALGIPRKGAGDAFQDAYGLGPVFRNVTAAYHRAFGREPVGFILGGVEHSEKTARFVWEGLDWTRATLAGRLVWTLVALGLAFLAALFFDRFDPARGRRRRAPASAPSG